MKQERKMHLLVKSALLSALLCVSALLVVPIGPVPFSLAILAVTLIGALLPPVWALASVATYLLLGAIGLPVFAGFSAGIGVLFGPTGGYLIGYFALAICVSFAGKMQWHLPLRFAFGVLGLLICYLLGTVWFMLVMQTGFVEALWVCVLPFALADFIKIAFAIALAQVLKKRLQQQN